MMKRLSNRVLILFSAVLALAMVVAACGGGDDTPAPTAAPAAPIVVVATPTPGATPTPQVIVQTAAPAATPTAAPTATPQIIVQTATAPPAQAAGSVTVALKAARFIQGAGLDGWRTPPKRGGTHVYGFPSASRGTDQIINRSYTVSTSSNMGYQKMFTCQYAPLLEVADPGACVPVGDLASEWSSNADASEWTVTIHPGAAWHDMPEGSRGYTSELSDLYGRPVVATDIIHSINYWQGNLIKPDGDPQPTPNALAYTRAITGMEAIDDKTIKLTLASPDPFFHYNFSAFNPRVMPPDVWELDGHHNDRMVGSGPFMLVEYDREIEWTGMSNPNYHKIGADGEPLPYIDAHKVIIMAGSLARSALITGQIHSASSIGISSPSTAVNFGRQCPDCQILEYFLPRNTSRILIFKHRPTDRIPDAPFADRRARLAVAKSIDYQFLINNVYEGAAIMTPISIGWALLWEQPPSIQEMGLDLPDDENPFVYDPDVAKRLWAESGHSPGETHELVYYAYSAAQAVYTEALAQSISETLEITIETLRASDIGIYYEKFGYINAEDLQNFTGFVTVTNNEAVHNALTPRKIRSFDEENTAGFESPAMDELATEWLLGPTPEREAVMAREYYTEVLKEMRWMPGPTEASYDAQSGLIRNSYQQLVGGRAYHHCAHCAEIVWIDD